MGKRNFILLLSGPIAVGKTSISDYLVQNFSFMRIKTSDYLKVVAAERGISLNRKSLQDLGDSLDAETNFCWVSSAARSCISNSQYSQHLLFDSIRKPQQLSDIRSKFSNEFEIFHAHLIASEETLRNRFNSRSSLEGEISNYESATLHPNEASARSLSQHANLVLDLSALQPAEAGKTILKKGGLI